MINYKLVTKTNKSYLSALKQAFDDFGHLDGRLGSGYTHWYGDGFETYSKDYSKANDISIRIEDLFEYGRPRIIQSDWWIYKDSYIKIEFYKNYHFEVFYEEFGKIKSNKHNIRIKFNTLGVGCGKWDVGRKTILEIANKMNPELQRRMFDVVDRSDKEIEKWRESITKINII